MSTFQESALAFVTKYIAFAEPIVFMLGLGESLLFVSFFIPSTVLFLAIGGLHSAAGGEFWPIWIAGAAGAFLGDLISFALGRYLKNDVRRIWPLTRYPDWYRKARLFFRRWGMIGIIFSKFLGMLRSFVPVVAGAMRMQWPRFAVASAISALLWAGVFLAPGYGIAWYMN